MATVPALPADCYHATCDRYPSISNNQLGACFFLSLAKKSGAVHTVWCRSPSLRLQSHQILLAAARKQAASKEILLWMTPSEAPKALQASECSELLDPMRASCWISAQH